MKVTLEKLWEEYLLDECAVIDTDEERELMEKIVKLHDKISVLLNHDQEDAMEKYVDALHDMESFFAKKAFFKGCEFSVSFLLETGMLYPQVFRYLLWVSDSPLPHKNPVRKSSIHPVYTEADSGLAADLLWISTLFALFHQELYYTVK